MMGHSCRRWGIIVSGAVVALATMGCGQRTLRIDYIPTGDKLEPHVVEREGGMFGGDGKIALISVSGLLANTKGGGLLGLNGGENPVSQFRETLHAIAKDDSVKAVVLRMNTPGGTVNAGDMMYRDLQAFKEKTHKPVIVEMMDLCASGGYYLSCAADYRIAYPTTITGSIGVIIQTMNFSGTLDKLGIKPEAITSRENKDMGSPFRPTTDNDRKLLKALVDQFYAQFLDVVKHSHQHVAESDWTMLTDGRVVTGRDAVRYGLIDQLGSLDDAIAKAKEMAHMKNATIIMYTHMGDYRGSVYAKAPATPEFNMVNVNIDTSALLPETTPEFLYMWKP